MSNFILKNEYTSKEECKVAIAKYNEGKLPEEKMRYCSYLNMVTRKRMYVPCSIEYFHAWRNMMAEEHRKRDLETRCLISSERYSYLKKCMEDCSKCPYGKDHRDGLPLSLDRFVEEDGYEIVDEIHSTPVEIIIEDERKDALAREIALLDEESQQILSLFNKGYSETQIAGLLGLTRDMIKHRKTALFQRLKKNLRNY